MGAIMAGEEDDWDEEEDDGDWNDWDDKDESEPELAISVSITEDDDDDNKRSTKGLFKAWEDEIIRDHWVTDTDEEIAKKIGRSIKAVERRRKILGYKKPNGRPKASNRAEAIYTNPTEYNLAKLSKDDRIKFYKAKFSQNPRYPWLTKMLMDEEVDYYKHKYIETIDSLDSVTMQEEDLLHNMIMKEITIIRIQTRIKQQEEAWQLAQEDDKPPLNMGLYKDINDAEKQYVDYQKNMKLTREQRLKTDKEEKITISGIVRAFLEAENREKAGKMAGQMGYSTNKCKEDMTKQNFLLGG